LTVAAVLGLASTAAALSVIVLTGSARSVTQAFDPDQDKEFQETDDVITFDFQLEQPAFISGYDIHVQWDANELDLLQLQERRSGGLEPIFDMAPDPNSEPLDTSDVRVTKSFTMSYAARRDMFSMTFAVLPAASEDATIDVGWLPALSSLAGAGIDNGNEPIGVDVVPEPSTAALLGLALAGLSLIRRWS
jgi:hypothetical protein